jgi:Transposase DDE domain
MTILDVARDWNLVLSYLPAGYEELAVEYKQLQTQYGNAKITTAEQLLRLMFVHVGAELPLRQTVTLVAAAGGPKVAPMRLHMKMRNAPPYLCALLGRMCPDRGSAAPELWGGYEMCALDATTVCGPGATGTEALLHTKMRLSDLRILEAKVTNNSVGETLKNFNFESAQLAIVDRGYSQAAGITWLRRQGADVLVRLNRGALPVFDEKKELIDVIEWARSIPDDIATERLASILDTSDPDADRIQGRLVAIRLPPDKAAEARKRVRREQGKEATAATLEMAAYVVLFTTAPKNRLSAARCLEAYHLRWQVELLYKRWKSLGGLDQLPNERDDTIRAWVYIKLLLGLIVERLGSASAELSPPVRLSYPARAPRKPRASSGATAVEDRQYHLADSRGSNPSALAL